MSEARVVTTTEKFDETGKLVERITKEEFPEKRECKCNCREEKNQARKDFFGNTMILYQEMW